MLGVGVVGSAISVELGVVGLQEQGNIPNPTGLLLLSVWGLELSVPVTLAGIGFLLDSSVSLLRTSLKIRKLQKQLDSAAQGPAETTN